MFRDRWIRGICLAACIAAAMLSVGAVCGGGDDDDDDGEDKAELDLIALVSGMFEETPRRLPDGLTFKSASFAANWGGGDITTVDFTFSGGAKSEGHAVLAVYRTESEARTEVTNERDLWEAAESTSARGRYCFWDEFTTYINIDFEGSSVCFGRSGNVFIEVEFGEVPSSDAEAAIPLLQAMERYVEGLAEDATERVRKVKPEPLAALLASLPPPGPAGVEFAADPRDTFPKDGDTSGLIVATSWVSGEKSGAQAFVSVYKTTADATAYREDNAASVKEAGKTGCAIPSDQTYRYCAHQLDEVVVWTQRPASSANAPAVDPFLQSWADAIVEHVDKVRSGRLPKSPKVTPTPPGTRTPTPPPATATPTSSSAVKRADLIWDFDITVRTNTCGGDTPALNTKMPTQYTFSDSNGDGFITAGEKTTVTMTKPATGASANITLSGFPSVTFAHSIGRGALTGTATVTIVFSGEDSGTITYTEAYASCKISNLQP